MPTRRPDTTHVRGDKGSYERYLAGMDASMQQKVALTAAHLLCRGTIADMGMGSGTGSHALAALYPSLDVVGVDLDPEIVALATERYRLPNLRFVVGDIATQVFEPESIDAILDSSVLHHVTSFGGYEHAAAVRALAVQVLALREHGVLVVRDFVAPGDDDDVYLDLSGDDGDAGDDPASCSTAALMRRFAREFRSLHAAPGFAVVEIDAAAGGPPLAPGRVRFRLPHRLAVEMLLRKDYRADWEAEVREEYTYLTQSGFESAFARMGLRVLASTPIRNPWIVANRFAGKMALHRLDGTPMEVPATNYVIVGERVAADRGVRFELTPAEPTGFLRLTHHRDRHTGKVHDLVRRPHLTIDAVPWFRLDDDVLVLARMSYPRPILRTGERHLDGSDAAGWITEPLTVIADDKPIAQTVEEALAARAGIPCEAILRFEPGATYYPSPGGVQEEVRACFVEIEPVLARAELPPSSGFSSSGRLGAIEARQLLRAAQVGGLPDARLEINVHALLGRLGLSPGPWIGARIEPLDRPPPGDVIDPATLRGRARRRRFVPVEERESPGFLARRAARFVEHSADGRVVAERVLEYVVADRFSHATIAVAVLRRAGDTVYLGIDDDDRPAAQHIGGHSDLLVAPAWRIPREHATITPALAFVHAQLHERHGVRAGATWELGGHYHPSAGVSPEVVHPIAVDAEAIEPSRAPLLWVPLAELIAHDDLLLDAHLRIVALRAAHALGLLARSSPRSGPQSG
jgi:hypothetical protein